MLWFYFKTLGYCIYGASETWYKYPYVHNKWKVKLLYVTRIQWTFCILWWNVQEMEKEYFYCIAEFENICWIQEIVQISHIHYFVLFMYYLSGRVLSLMILSTFLASELCGKVKGFISEIHAQIRHFLLSITAKKVQREMFYLRRSQFLILCYVNDRWMNEWMNTYIHIISLVQKFCHITVGHETCQRETERERERT